MAEISVNSNLRLKKTVVLVGMMGAGKTAVGKALASLLHVPFRDSDAEIESAANMTIAEIFERDGEPFFRQKEGQIIERLLEGPPCILSNIELLWSRVRHKDSRPLLRTENPKQTLAALFEARVPIYQMADLQVTTNPRNSIEDTARSVIEALKTREDVLEDN